MKKHLGIISLCLGLLVASCGDGRNTSEEKKIGSDPIPEVKTQLGLGMVHENIAFKSDPSLSYAIYLPVGMQSKETYPVLYCIDPHGQGKYPLYMYRELADSFNIILVGSNTSKNGMPFVESEKGLNQLIAEVQSLFPVENAVRLLGFSGGAKVAIEYANRHPEVRQVLYAGGVTQLSRQNNISLLGFAGIRDMNYADLVGFEVSLGNAPFQHQLIEWDGAHEFPSANVMRDGFYFILNDSVENYLEKRPRTKQENIMREQLLKRKFFQAFNTKELKWWQTEITALHEYAKTDVMYERILGFIGLGCYSLTSNAIDSGDLQKAEYAIAIYLAATPENEDAKKFAAQIQEMKKKRQ